MLHPGQRFDQFEVLRRLGYGTYASTWLARDEKTAELVVLKVPSPATLTDPEAVSHFRREAAIARRLRHPAIQSAAGSVPPRGAEYLALAYIAGETLREWLHENNGPVPVEMIYRIGKQTAEALAYLHANGVVHRDIKPENILLGDDGSLRVIDFGSALLKGPHGPAVRRRAEASGTPDYMAPEQIEGHRGDARTDIYGLGAVLYELAAGQAPFGGDNANAVMYQQLHVEPVPPRVLRPDLPGALDAAIMKSLSKPPEQRQQRAEELKADLEQLGQPPLECTVSAPRRHTLPWRIRVVRQLRRRIKS